jgi:hypothetical protein
MARKKKPENETNEQTNLRKTLEQIANVANRSDKMSWNRKMDKMVKLIVKLKPIEEKILDIILNEKTPLMDDIQTVRDVMVAECIHPYEYLTSHVDPITENKYIVCKFCDKKMRNPNVISQKTQT